MDKLNEFFEKITEKAVKFFSDKTSLSYLIPLGVMVVAFAVICIAASNARFVRTLRAAKKAVIKKDRQLPTAINEDIAKAETSCVKPSEFFTSDKYVKLPSLCSIVTRAARVMFGVVIVSAFLAMALSMLCYGSLFAFASVAIIAVIAVGAILCVLCALVGSKAVNKALRAYNMVSDYYDQKYNENFKKVYEAEERGVGVDVDLISEIDRIYEHGESLPKMKEIAVRLQEERLKPENQDSASQQALSAALNKLLKAMDEAINR